MDFPDINRCTMFKCICSCFLPIIKYNRQHQLAIIDQFHFFYFSNRELFHPNEESLLTFPIRKAQRQLDFSIWKYFEAMICPFGIEVFLLFIWIFIVEATSSCGMCGFSCVDIFMANR